MEITECKGIQTLQYRHLFLQGKRKMNVLMLLASRDVDFSTCRVERSKAIFSWSPS